MKAVALYQPGKISYQNLSAAESFQVVPSLFWAFSKELEVDPEKREKYPRDHNKISRINKL